MAKDEIEDMKAALLGDRSPVVGPVPQTAMLSTGSTLLNLAITNRPFGGFSKGKYFWMVGDSSSGKTFIALTQMAEAAINKNFDNYDFIYDNNEDGALMDIGKLFGQKVVDRMRAPHYVAKQPQTSRTVEEFYFNVDRMIQRAKEKGRPAIYVLDSESGLSSDAEQKKFEEKKKAHDADKEISGTMTDSKAKMHSSNLRRIIPELRETGCILIVLSQSRTNLGFGAMFNPKTVSGGMALEFYATVQIWFSKLQKIKKRVHGKERSIGINVQIKLKKNRFTGKDRTIEIPIYWSYGFDDIGSCVDWLIEESFWKPSKTVKGAFACPEFRFRGSRDEIVAHIEANNLEKELKVITGDAWNKIEAECNVERKPRYG